VVADSATGTLEVTDLRTSEAMINVLSFLEPPPLSGMTIDFNTLYIDFANGTVSVDVILSHPIPDPVFMGFDVRGVVFGPKLTNADGLTPVMAPKNFSNEAFGYIDGLLGAPYGYAKYSGELNGYKYFCNNLGTDADLVAHFSDPANLANRGVFSDGLTLKRHYELDWNGTEYNILVFNYAVYANYDWPVGPAPIELEDFDINNANSAEAFCVSVTELDNTLHYVEGVGSGGSISLLVEAWDWQGNISNVTVESLEPAVIGQTPFDTYLGQTGLEFSYLYEFNDVPGYPYASGPLDILITVTDAKTFGESWFMNLLSFSNALYNERVYASWVYTTNVADYPPCYWDPNIQLNINYDTKCRATDESIIPDVHSSYDSQSQFDVTGTNADGQGTIIYQYYASTSDSNQTGSPVGWVEFHFDNGGSFTVPWADYDSIAPNFMHIWIRAWDGLSGSNPVLCDDTIALSKVYHQASTFDAGTGWFANTSSSGNIQIGDQIVFQNNDWGTSYAYAYHNGISWPTHQATMEFYIPQDWVVFAGSYARPGIGPDANLGTFFTTIANATAGQVLKYSTTTDLGGTKYFGFYFWDAALLIWTQFFFYIDDVAIYDDPV
jgi:hypothetical protein